MDSNALETPSIPGNDEAQAVWRACLESIREQLNTQSFKTWFEPIVPLHVRGTTLTVQVPSQFFYDWIEEHYTEVIKRALPQVLGRDAEIEYLIHAEDPQLDLEYAPASALPREVGAPAPVLPLTPRHARHEAKDQPFQTFLNPRYTFENFIKGDSNQLARAAASAVANNPGGTSFNPLVIYGGTGLGKTHLIQAIGNSAIANGKAKRVIYVSSEKFTVEFVEAIQSDRAGDFINFYRSMDVLIVDDIQFFAGKEKTQDSFFHTFNELHQIGKQIVLSSDRPPKELKGLDDRLLSRFQ